VTTVIDRNCTDIIRGANHHAGGLTRWRVLHYATIFHNPDVTGTVDGNGVVARR
jgi:hypothetical protein